MSRSRSKGPYATHGSNWTRDASQHKHTGMDREIDGEGEGVAGAGREHPREQKEQGNTIEMNSPSLRLPILF